MKRRDQISKAYVDARKTSRLGLGLGREIGLLDPSRKPTASDKFDTGKWDKLHRELTVVDAYSAAVDLEDLRRGGVDVVIQAVGAEEMYARKEPAEAWEPPVPGEKSWTHVFTGPEIVERIEIGIDEHKRFAEAYRDYIEVALSQVDAQRIVQSGKIAMALMLMSGFINDDLAVLRRFHQLGIRVMAPCHLGAHSWADSTSELNVTPGLTDFGREVIAECNTIGILVDLAHASDQTCQDTLEVATKPTIATHTKCRALSKSPRDVSDDTMRAIAAQGGVVGILAPAPRTAAESHAARIKRDRRLAENYPDPFDLAEAKLADAEVWGTKLDLASINHAVSIAGIEHVGLSSHFQNVPQWKEFTEVLFEHGYSEEDSRKLLGDNVLRVLGETIH